MCFSNIARLNLKFSTLNFTHGQRSKGSISGISISLAKVVKQAPVPITVFERNTKRKMSVFWVISDWLLGGLRNLLWTTWQLLLSKSVISAMPLWTQKMALSITNNVRISMEKQLSHGKGLYVVSFLSSSSHWPLWLAVSVFACSE